MNIGEEICGEWLRHIKGCEFVQYNLQTTHVQGEIDVIGINLTERKIYVCEVAVHLVTGLNYVTGAKPDNVQRIVAKFRKDIAYARMQFPEYQHEFMLWSPVVKHAKADSKLNQMRDVQEVVDAIRTELDATVELVINERFQTALDEMRSYARAQTKELDSTVMRYLQVEEYLRKYLTLRKKKARNEAILATAKA